MTKMTEVKVAEAIGPALDWMVAIAEGKEISINLSIPYRHSAPVGEPFIEHYDEEPWPGADSGFVSYSPSTDWSQGGTLIQKHGCDLNCISAANCLEANCWDSGSPNPDLHLCEAESPLIAACRSIVKAKLGDKVMVPAELAASKQEAS